MPKGDAPAEFGAGEPSGLIQGLFVMAVRHEVENLIRSGNIFYWRPRVPAVFTHCRPGSRLSLSLHCSDHKKAQIIGRKLNTRLAELKTHSKEPMSKQQLQKLCEHERDKELERLEKISDAAKRFGRAGDVVEMELDLEAGWAYQLLAKFGTRAELSLEGACVGLTYLLRNGVPASHVDAGPSELSKRAQHGSKPRVRGGHQTIDVQL